LVLTPRLVFLFVALGGIAPATAQFFGLATPSDGSVVYFATPLWLKGTGEPQWGKLFQVDFNGLSLAEVRPYEVPDPPPVGYATGPGLAHPTNRYDIRGVDVSAGGLVRAVAGWRGCGSQDEAGQYYCLKMENYYTTITSGTQSTDYPGNLRLSANGEWALGPSSHGVAEDAPTGTYVVNVKTGAQSLLPVGWPYHSFRDYPTSGRPIANDGTGVVCDDGGVEVLTGSSMLRIPVSQGTPVGAVIDPAGHTVVYGVCANRFCVPFFSSSLYVADVVSGSSSLLASDGYAPSITDDGRRVLYISLGDGTPQLWIVEADGTGRRQLTHDSAGVSNALLSGDGSVAYAVTRGGRLLKIAVSSGAIQELVPRTPYLGLTSIYQSISSSFVFAPGAIVSLAGAGFSDSSFAAGPPLPETLGDVTVTIQGEAARIQSVDPATIMVLAPLDLVSTVSDTAHLAVQAPSSSPFDLPPASSAVIHATAPSFLTAKTAVKVPVQLAGTDYIFPILAAHEDWSGLVTPENPASPGEVVHAYATGLGPTSLPVPYGDAAPAQEPLARLIAPYTCGDVVVGGPIPIEVLFQGLAPALAGYDQVDWRVPSEPNTGWISISCLGGGVSFSGWIPAR
jgi:uncharacterized protein (TIGR03437 family)